jgi:hypothetical protein
VGGFESGDLSNRELDRVLPGALTLLGRLRSPAPADDGLERRDGHYACIERRCELRLFGAYFSWSKSVSTWSSAGRIARDALARRARGRRLGYAIGGIAGAGLAAAAVSAAFFTPASPKGASSLLVPLPPPIALSASIPLMPAEPEKEGAKPKAAKVAKDAEPAPKRNAPKLATLTVPEASFAPPHAATGPLADRAAVRDALARAFRSGETESWSDNGVDGFVVVGAAETVGGKSCRDIAVLARDGSFEGNTASGRKCLTRAGVLVNP